ncbi:unnamed protein product [Staurois parvus]|uniref:Uncharacterized protein n=1 Tax=Staurois parvus TaxID=386267 RepID=A0ABN9GA74_9NEOB|nr:unnamed protein product [Staurois parvus]
MGPRTDPGPSGNARVSKMVSLPLEHIHRKANKAFA